MQSPATQAFATVKLEQPIRRGDTEIAEVQLRQPKAGELRNGISTVDIAKLDVDTMFTLLPRITVPPLIEQELAELIPADWMAMVTEVANFFLPQSARVA